MSTYSNGVLRNPVFQCLGKRRYETKARAKQSLRTHRKQGLLCSYRCPHCGYFHVGRRA